MPRPFTFLHLANHGSRNIGNAALIGGLERILREDLGEIAFEPEPWDLYSRGELRFDEAFVERVNRDADALLVGAAVSFDGGRGYPNTGFRFDLPLDLWERIERPIVFYGLSHRGWSRRRFYHRDRLRETFERALDLPHVLFSVRNDGSKEWLEALLGMRLDQVRVVPDPAVFVATEETWHPELVPGRPNILVAPNSEDELERFGASAARRALRRPTLQRPVPVSSTHSWREHRSVYLNRVANVLTRLALEHDANIVYCSHEPFDVGMAFGLLELVHPDVRYSTTFSAASLPVVAGPTFYDLYAQADLVLGMRIHSMTPPIGLATPVVPIVSQDRMRAFMADVGVSDLCVEALDPELETELYAKSVAALAGKDALSARLREAATSLRARSAAFNAEVAAHVGLQRIP